MRIELHTQLHSGIYQSQGGGEDVIVKTFKASPRGYTLALKALAAERAENERCYGNIGRGSSWLQLDGQQLNDDPFGDSEAERWQDRVYEPVRYEAFVTDASDHNPYAAWPE